jgi:hypothetical protein
MMKSGEGCNKCIAAHVVYKHSILVSRTSLLRSLCSEILQKDAAIKRASQTTAEAKSRRKESPAVSPAPMHTQEEKRPPAPILLDTIEILH